MTRHALRPLPVALLALLTAALATAGALAADAPPGPAQNVTVADVPGDTGVALRVTFSRSADDGTGAASVTSYKLFTRVPGGTPTYLSPIAATGVASYGRTISGLIPGQQYGVGVIASTGTVDATAVVVWATPLDNLTPPNGPGTVTVSDVAGDAGTALRLTFLHSPDDGGGTRDVVEYKVFTRVAGGTANYLTPIPATGATSYALKIGGLTPGTSYGVGVAASDGALTSAFTVVWAVPVDNLTPPPPPRDVAVVDTPADTGTGLRLTFTRSLDDRTGGDVTGYRVFRRLVGGAPAYLPLVPATGAATYTVALTGLTAGQRYGVGVSSYDGSLYSTPVVVWATPLDNVTPKPPAGMTIADPPADNGQSLALNFLPSPDDRVGGSVTAYDVYQRTGTTTFAPIRRIAATHASRYSLAVTGLTRGTRYGFGVRATDGLRYSSMVTRWATPQDTLAPQPPHSPVLSNPPADDGTTLQLSFLPSVDDYSGGDVVAYRIYRRTSDTGFTQIGSVRATAATGYTYLARRLTLGVRYGFGVAAFDGVNESEKVSVWGDTAPPGAPQNVQLVDYPGDDGTALKLTFSRSADDGAGRRDVTLYRLFGRTADTPLAPLGTIKATGAATYALTVPDLARGVNYAVAVCAYDGFQESARVVRWAVPADNTPPAAPGTPTAGDWPDDDGTAVAVTFTRSADDNSTDPEVSSYVVYRATTATGTGVRAGSVNAGCLGSYQVKCTGLTTGTTYYFWVVAVGRAGTSAPTARCVGQALDLRIVAAPTGLTAADHPYDKGGVIDLTWIASAEDSAGRVARYEIYYRSANAVYDWTCVGTVPATRAASYAWSHTSVPLDSVLYEYCVRAVSTGGVSSAYSASAKAAAADNNVLSYEPPTSLTATAGSSSGDILLRWKRSTSEDDSTDPPDPPVSSIKAARGALYEVFRRTAGGAYTTLPTFTVSANSSTDDPMSYTDTGLTVGVTYYYKVRFRCYNLISPFTAEVSSKPAGTASLSGSGSAADSGSGGEGSTLAPLSAMLLGVPGEVAAGHDLVLRVAVTGSGRSSVCLQYSVAGAVAQTAAVSGSGSYEASLRLRTASLPAGSVVTVRAVVTAADARLATSAPAQVTVTP